MTFQKGHWEAQIYEATLLLWVRVHALALARSEPNLHTGIGPDELAVLGETGPDGSRKPVDRRRLWEAIKRLSISAGLTRHLIGTVSSSPPQAMLADGVGQEALRLPPGEHAQSRAT